ncbi:gliding motility-associated C-terminal domain-containing protein [Pontibacter vulgaris]|uniref:T9SS type B sorting domain-containing protein n=1 Tax=Pontibacter vulgaris TaxID=2905679 RepID=UPI001FA7D2B2|nr:gliding motility-associated C-terminal domain-containing protein [Pontibacter vulgaris]
MRYLLLVFFVFACCIPKGGALAQKQTNVWYFGNAKAGLDFNQAPPRVLSNGAMVASEGVATMADSTGKLLFYTNGESIWNREHRVMVNGSGMDGHVSARQGVVIVPQPGSKNQYFVFTTDAFENKFAKGLRYSVVDMARQDGLGEVVSKNTFLHPLSEENLTATGGCCCSDSDRYWVASDSQDRPGVLYAYRIDAAGVNPQPVESFLPGVTNITYLKFSPSGDRLAFTGLTHNDASVIGIADFNATTGRFSNLKLVPVANKDYHRAVEFSGDGKLLYFTTWSNPQLTQYDLSHESAEEMALTAVPLFQHSVYSLHSPQLASDGKIYLSAFEGQSGQTSMAVIERPNLLGQASLFRLQVFSGVGSYMLPNFVTSLLYLNELLEQHANAGPDKQVCANEPAQLGGAPNSRLRYSWSLGTFLSDTAVADPIFRFTGEVDKITTLQYVLTVSDGPCARRDTVEVTVYPLPKAIISGPRSVCPMVEGVAYGVEEIKGHAYHWRIGGGTIRSGQGTAAVSVDWGKTNAAAWIEVTPVNVIGCEGPPVRVPVRVNVELDTETPKGLQSVCLNQNKGNTYQVTLTNGSTYTWGAVGGKVVSGQGTAKAVVDWDGIGKKKLWVQEQSTTIDTVCYGVSDTLHINVFRDPTTISLDFVTITGEEDTQSRIQWQVDGTLSTAASLQRRVIGTSNWAEAASVPNIGRGHTDTGIRAKEEIYEYRVVAQNSCGEEIASDAHRTMLLRGEADADQEYLMLNWSAYVGWREGVSRYQVWRKVDNEVEYSLLQEVDGGTLSLAGLSATAGFNHRYRIKALATGKPFESRSNSIELSFEHALSIPNIFSPNNDGYNDTFSIPKLELYPDNELVVVNRLGQEVYRKKSYQGSWNGGNVVSGVYYYSLYVGKLSKYFKGWVEVVR